MTGTIEDVSNILVVRMGHNIFFERITGNISFFFYAGKKNTLFFSLYGLAWLFVLFIRYRAIHKSENVV